MGKSFRPLNFFPTCSTDSKSASISAIFYSHPEIWLCICVYELNFALIKGSGLFTSQKSQYRCALLSSVPYSLQLYLCSKHVILNLLGFSRLTIFYPLNVILKNILQSVNKFCIAKKIAIQISLRTVAKICVFFFRDIYLFPACEMGRSQGRKIS